VVAGELDFTPFRVKRLARTPVDGRSPFERNVAREAETGIAVDDPRFQDPETGGGLWINGPFQRFGLIYFRLELLFHAEGGTVLEDAGDPALAASSGFLRLGGTAGVTFGFRPLERLRLHAHLQYGVEVAGDGPDVDQFLGSADWRLDEAGRLTLTAEYRNGRSPLLVQRDNRLTIGLGVKF
jgi:hypothetical protein